MVAAAAGFTKPDFVGLCWRLFADMFDCVLGVLFLFAVYFHTSSEINYLLFSGQSVYLPRDIYNGNN